MLKCNQFKSILSKQVSQEFVDKYKAALKIQKIDKVFDLNACKNLILNEHIFTIDQLNDMDNTMMVLK